MRARASRSRSSLHGRVRHVDDPTCWEGSRLSASACSTASATPSTSLAVGDCTGAIDFAAGSVIDLPALSCTGDHYWGGVRRQHRAVRDVPGCSDDRGDGEGLVRAGLRRVRRRRPGGTAGTPAYLAGDADVRGRPGAPHDHVPGRLVERGLLGSAKGDTRIFPPTASAPARRTAAAAVEVIDCAEPHYYEVFANEVTTGKKAPTVEEEQKPFTSVCPRRVSRTSSAWTRGSRSTRSPTSPAGSDIWKQVGDHWIVRRPARPTEASPVRVEEQEEVDGP